MVEENGGEEAGEEENEEGEHEDVSRLVVEVKELVPLAAHGAMNTTSTSAISGTTWRMIWANV